MTKDEPMGGEVSRAPGLQGLIPPPPDEILQDTVRSLIKAGGGSVAAILLYGSRVQNSNPDQWSAYDLLVLVDAYSPFFRAMGPKAHHRRSPRTLVLFSQFLPPNVISFGRNETGLPAAKCAIVNRRHLRGFLGRRSRDHFLKGRAVQTLALAWTRNVQDETEVMSALREAREGVPHWVRPHLTGAFDLETFARSMLRVSYQGEIRPESPDRVDEVFRSQKQVLMAIAQESLGAAGREGFVLRDGDLYRWKVPPGFLSKAGSSLYFTISKIRATTRWFKYVVTFDGWIDYIVRKIQRRAGFAVQITERERRWPLILLWPKFFRVVKALRSAEPRNGGSVEEGDEE